jgi:transcriptional regulator with XRE-family HTH domain
VFALGFGNRLRKLRETRGMTQRDLADRFDIELIQISRYERGLNLPNAETLVSLSEVLQVDLNLLLVGETNTHVAAADLNLDLPLLERFRDLQKLPVATARLSSGSSIAFSHAVRSSRDLKNARDHFGRCTGLFGPSHVISS